MGMPIAGFSFYTYISPSGIVYLAIMRRLSMIIPGTYQYQMAYLISFVLIHILLEIFYFKFLWQNKKALASNLPPSPSPA